MGRPYKQELNAISDTYKYADSFETSGIDNFFKYNCDRPLLVIGSGGSYAVAKAFELCYQSYGGFAKTVTPYELQNEKYVIGNSKVLIVTAGGNNPDTVGVYNYVRLYEPFSLCVICMSQKSKIAKLIRENKDAILFEGNIPFGKDGYLAVNSSVAMFAIVKRLLESLENNAAKKLKINTLMQQRDDLVEMLGKCTNLLVMYGGWGTPAAFDLESKCSEAGLISVQYVDYRNFAHGRHNWIDKMGDTTVIVALTTPDEILIRNKTLDKLPGNIPRILLSAEQTGSIGALELLIQIFYLTDILGDIRQIDPGRPQVPEYGSQLYHVKYNLKIQDKYLKSLLRDRKKYCIYRKLKEIKDEQWVNYFSDMYDTFVENLYKEKYGALVLDCDGTIIDEQNKVIPDNIARKLNDLLAKGIIIGIATGRGDSIISILRSTIEEKYWKKVFIGFYNGSFISTLDKEYCRQNNTTENLKKFKETIRQYPWIASKIIVKDYQLSIRESDTRKLDLYFKVLNEFRLNHGFTELKVCKSGHAVDVIEKKYGKQNLVSYVKRLQPYEVLCIGDGGEMQENDFEFLSLNIGLSAEHQNSLGKSGWNLAPAGNTRVNAVKYYFDEIEIKEGFFIYKRS